METEEIENIALEMIEGAKAQSIPLCLFGGLGIRLACKRALEKEPILSRPLRDIDFVSFSKYQGSLDEYFTRFGCVPYQEFNILYAASRQKYSYKKNYKRIEIDIIFDSLRMCHVIPLIKNLLSGDLTLPLAELLLTKLQIVEFTQNDTIDTLALLLEVNIRQIYLNDRIGFDANYFLKLCSKNWGLWYTVKQNLGRIVSGLENIRVSETSKRISQKTAKSLLNLLENSHKNISWHIRSFVGPRVRWYEKPETE